MLRVTAITGLALLCALTLAAQGRVRPPASLTCDRNQLTVHEGTPVQWSRTATGARLVLNTDSGTRESFALVFREGEAAERWFLLDTEPLKVEDWQRLEAEPGKLKEGIRAHVWVCTGDANPVIDWRLPPR